jgi:hypothetical protein
MNLSRAYTLRAQRGGSRALLTVGRVQTPTLALVVGRDREIEAFKPVPYHTIKAVVSTPAAASPPPGRRRKIKPAWTAKAALSIPPSPMPWWPPSRASRAPSPSTNRKPRSRTSRWPSRCPTLPAGLEQVRVQRRGRAEHLPGALRDAQADQLPAHRLRLPAGVAARRRAARPGGRQAREPRAGRPGRWCRSAHQVQDVGRLEDHRAPRHRADHAEGQQGRLERARAQHLRPDRARLPGAVLPAARVHADHRGRGDRRRELRRERQGSHAQRLA